MQRIVHWLIHKIHTHNLHLIHKNLSTQFQGRRENHLNNDRHITHPNSPEQTHFVSSSEFSLLHHRILSLYPFIIIIILLPYPFRPSYFGFRPHVFLSPEISSLLLPKLRSLCLNQLPKPSASSSRITKKVCLIHVIELINHYQMPLPAINRSQVKTGPGQPRG